MNNFSCSFMIHVKEDMILNGILTQVAEYKVIAFLHLIFSLARWKVDTLLL